MKETQIQGGRHLNGKLGGTLRPISRLGVVQHKAVNGDQDDETLQVLLEKEKNSQMVINDFSSNSFPFTNEHINLV